MLDDEELINDPELLQIADELAKELEAMGLDKEPEDDPSRLYIPYSFRFRVGDRLRLKTGQAYAQAREEILSELAKTNIPADISWVPTPQMIALLAEVPFTVVMTMAYHCGYPLCILHFQQDGTTHECRLCEAFLQMDERTERTTGCSPISDRADAV